MGKAWLDVEGKTFSYIHSLLLILLKAIDDLDRHR
jgi:hypothetical protein